MYKTETGETIHVMEVKEKALAIGGYESKNSYTEELELPPGKNELILTNKKGDNYKITLDIKVID